MKKFIVPTPYDYNEMSEILVIIEDDEADKDWALVRAREILLNNVAYTEDKYDKERFKDMVHKLDGKNIRELTEDYYINFGCDA